MDEDTFAIEQLEDELFFGARRRHTDNRRPSPFDAQHLARRKR